MAGKTKVSLSRLATASKLRMYVPLSKLARRRKITIYACRNCSYVVSEKGASEAMNHHWRQDHRFELALLEDNGKPRTRRK